jgi:hypothetical protein
MSAKGFRSCVRGGTGPDARAAEPSRGCHMSLVCLRVDASGIWPVLLHERDEFACANGVEWRFVASVEDAEEGERLLAQLHYELKQRRPARADAFRGHARAQSVTAVV